MSARFHLSMEDKKIVLDLEVIYARVLALRHINPDLNFEKILVYELAPDCRSMFNEKGVIHPCNQKSKLMAGLMVEDQLGKPVSF